MNAIPGSGGAVVSSVLMIMVLVKKSSSRKHLIGFRGTWTGEGEFGPHPLLRWIVRRERVRLTSEPVWLSDTIWLVKDRFEVSSGSGCGLDRKMFCELVGPDLIHVTADDMPGGADIQVYDRGFRFTPYLVVVNDRGVTVCLRCRYENILDERGFIHDLVKMYFWGVRVATMRLGPINRNVERSDKTLERTGA